MSIPPLRDGRLPPGDWDAEWEEVSEVFAYNFRRREIVEGLRHVASQLRAHGVEDMWIDGSFITDKERPNDADVVYRVPTGGDSADWADVGPSRRSHVKKFHRVDLWRYPAPQPSKNAPMGLGGWMTIKEFFETDTDGNPRGLLHLRLSEEGWQQ